MGYHLNYIGFGYGRHRLSNAIRRPEDGFDERVRELPRDAGVVPLLDGPVGAAVAQHRHARAVRHRETAFPGLMREGTRRVVPARRQFQPDPRSVRVRCR